MVALSTNSNDTEYWIVRFRGRWRPHV